MGKKVALITGASAGIGKEAALVLQRKGFKVYGAARRTERMQDIAKQGVEVMALDVTSEDSMVKCVDEILKREGRIDVLVNNAGYGFYGAVEDVPLEEARKQVEVNVFGLARMTQLVLPTMRKQHSGKIVNVSSIAGKMCTPFGAWYHVTKYAVEAFSDCLRMETKPFGIDVIIVEPGMIKTDWGLIAADNLHKTSKNGAYSEHSEVVVKYLRKMYNSDKISKPELIAQTIEKAVTAKKPKTRYLVGNSARLSMFGKRWLTDRGFDKLIQGYMR